MLLQQCKRSALDIIINDLRALSMRFFQKVPIREFYGMAWEKEDKMRATPCIYQNAQTSNALSYYFTDLIISRKTAAQRGEIITALVEIAARLVQADQSIGPDIFTTLAIVAALNMNFITRLKLSFACLDEKVLKKLKDLETVVDSNSNYKFLRALQSQYAQPLPHLSILLRDKNFYP